MRGRVPIDHPTPAVDQIFLVEIDKNSGDGSRVSFVHRVTLARPVARTTEAFELLNDDAAVFVLPFDHALQKLFAAEIVTSDTFILA